MRDEHMWVILCFWLSLLKKVMRVLFIAIMLLAAVSCGIDEPVMPGRNDGVWMPFNSTANDYMMAIDEFNHLGWFASDRNQPQDSVCIYVFIPNESKQTYNYENTGIETIIDAATLRNIQKTWENASVVEAARQRLADIRNKQTSTKQEMKEFTFIVNDRFTYHKYEDFRSKQASNRYRQLRQKQEDLKELSQSLAEKRTLYSFESSAGKDKLAPSILDLEKRIPQLEAEIEELTIEVRNLEIQQLNK